MARDTSYAWVFPLEPAQYVNNSGLRRGEPSGEIFCPLKLAHIGVMRCGEYQAAHGCGESCTAKAVAQDIERARAEVTNYASDTGGKRSLTCRQCGGPKRGYYSEVCASCRPQSKNGPYLVNRKGRGW